MIVEQSGKACARVALPDQATAKLEGADRRTKIILKKLKYLKYLFNLNNTFFTFL
jgi:hypothetical protein